MRDVIEGAFAVHNQARVSFFTAQGQKGLKAVKIKVIQQKKDETGYSTVTTAVQVPKMNNQWAQKYVTDYESMAEDVEELLMKLNSDNLFMELISLPTLPAEETVIPKLVHILLALQKAFMQEWVNKIFVAVVESPFMKEHIPQYLIKKAAKNAPIIPFVQDLLTLCQDLIHRFPSKHFRLPIDALQTAVITYDDKTLTAGMAKLVDARTRLIKSTHKDPTPAVNNAASFVAPPNDFRAMSIFPTDEDIATDTASPFLRPIILEGAYDNVDHYLDIHFRLLREDFLKSLRDGINAYKAGSTEWRGEIRVYTEVQVKEVVFTRAGIVHKIELSIL